MPKVPINFKKSVIYKICCDDVSITDVYVGSTTNLSKRKPVHKYKCNNERDKAHNLNVYQFIRANGGWDNWDVVVVEEYPCDSKNQLHTRERHHMEPLNATLNKVIPTRTQKEYQKEYQKENVEKIKARKKEYYQENAEKLKEWREENSEKIRVRQRVCKTEKIPCPHCNKILSRGSMTRHIKSQHRIIQI